METFGDYASHAIAKSFRKSIKPEAEVLQDHDPEPLHQMRVGMRRLRTVLQVFEPAIVLPKAVSINRIRTVAHVLGAVRDLDVLQRELEHPELPAKEQKRLQQVRAGMHKQRQRDFRALEKTLASDHYQGWKQSLKAWLHQPTYQTVAQLPILAVLPDLLLPLVSQLLLHPAWLIDTTEMQQTRTPEDPEVLIVQFLGQQAETLHDLRKQIKRVRYQMELFVDFYGSSYQEQLQEFQTLQELLGQIQDGFVLGQFLQRTLEVDLERKLPTLNQQLQQQQLQCWQRWQSYRHRYLDPDFRQSLRQQLLLPRADVASQPAA